MMDSVAILADDILKALDKFDGELTDGEAKMYNLIVATTLRLRSIHEDVKE